jgi:hypothetical protein
MLRRRRRRILLAEWPRPWQLSCGLAGFLLLHAGVLRACPVCFSAANPRVLETYYLTTVLMMLLPLVILGSIAGWLYSRFRESDPDSTSQAIEPS